MRRSVDGKETRRIVSKFREKVPGIVLRTTMIVGHPGEDKRAFEELLHFVEEAKFERLGAFTYSQEEGTYSALNFKDTISQKVKQERYDRLMELQSGISLNYNLSRVGKKETVLIDSLSDGVLVSRSRSESPEVDGEILIGMEDIPAGFEPEKLIGTFAQVEIIKADEYDLLARIIK
jgi:ribosomal protein S12 methylthiotransferase